MSTTCNNIWDNFYNGNGYAPASYSLLTAECEIPSKNLNTICNNQGISASTSQITLNSKNNVSWLDNLTTCHHVLGAWCDKCNFSCKFNKLTPEYVNSNEYKRNTLLCCTDSTDKMSNEERVSICDYNTCPGTQVCLNKSINICKEAYQSKNKDLISLCKNYEQYLVINNSSDYQTYVNSIISQQSDPQLIYDLCSQGDCSSFLQSYCLNQTKSTATTSDINVDFKQREEILLSNPLLKKICGCNLPSYPLKGFVPKECLTICNSSQNLNNAPCLNNICYFDKTSIDKAVPSNTYFDLSIACDTTNRNSLKTCFFSSDIGDRMVGSEINLNTICSACYNGKGIKTDCNSFLIPSTSTSSTTRIDSTLLMNFWNNNKIIIGIIIVIILFLLLIYFIVTIIRKFKSENSINQEKIKVVYVKEPQQIPLIPADQGDNSIYI
jgi:hypothetical protein